jgi:chromatin remodeling complex protein RSC6
VSSAISIGNENNIMTIHKQTRTHSLCPEKDAGYLKGKKENEKKTMTGN